MVLTYILLPFRWLSVFLFSAPTIFSSICDVISRLSEEDGLQVELVPERLTDHVAPFPTYPQEASDFSE